MTGPQVPRRPTRRGVPLLGELPPRATVTHEAFMQADGGLRARSPEVDYGTWWDAGDGRRARISWIEATGELYAVTFADGEPVEVLGILHRRELVDEALAERNDDALCPSLEWARDRLTDWAPTTPSARMRGELARQLWAERREAILEGREYLGLGKRSVGMTLPKGWTR